MKCDLIKKTVNSRSDQVYTSIWAPDKLFCGMPIIAYVLKVSIQELFLKTVTNYVKWVKEITQCTIVVFSKCNIE